MDFESPDVMKDFPGLYACESKKCTNDSDYSDDTDKVTKKDTLIGKRKEKKDKKDKERGYAALEGESSAEEEYDLRSPSKSKKPKSFKFSSKSKEKREKSRDKEKDVNEKRKEKKTEKKIEKVKVDKKDRKLKQCIEESTDVTHELPIFGASLEEAVERGRCHDGIDLPLPVRDCIDYIESNGFQMEGLYKVSGTKSKVLQLKKMYNNRENVNLSEYDVPTATSLLKLFLRELPEAIFTNDLLIRFEEAGAILNLGTREKHLKILIENLPLHNKLLISWLITHLNNVTLNEKYNKMNKHSIAAALSPTLHTSHRLLQALLHHCTVLFPNVILKKYIPPLTSQLPDELNLMEIELKKQESLLTQIHAEMNVGFILKHREELLWEVQRIITQLKRKLKIAQKDKEVPQKPKEIQEEEVIQENIQAPVDKISVNSDEVDTIKENSIEKEESPVIINEINKETCDQEDNKQLTDNTNEKRDLQYDSLMLLKFKHDALSELKDTLMKQIISEQNEIKTLTNHLRAQEKPTVIPACDVSNWSEVMDLLYKENQVLQIKKIDLVRQIMEQQEICIDLRARLETSKNVV